MIMQLSEKAAIYLIKEKIIKADELDVYRYGIELCISQFIATFLIFIMGTLLGYFVETFIYYIIYTFLRIYAGGFHASCYRNCNFIYLFVYINIIIIIEYLEKNAIVMPLFIGLLIANYIIAFLAPIPDINKKLEPKEYIKYSKVVKRLLVLDDLIIIFIYLFIPDLRDEILFGIAAICEIAVLLVLGKIKKLIYHKMNYEV